MCYHYIFSVAEEYIKISKIAVITVITLGNPWRDLQQICAPEEDA